MVAPTLTTTVETVIDQTVNFSVGPTAEQIYSIPRGDSYDATPKLQALLDELEGEGGGVLPLHLPGIYALRSQLKIPDNILISMSPNTFLARGYNGGGETHAAIVAKNTSNPTNIFIRGGGFYSLDAAYTGKTIYMHKVTNFGLINSRFNSVYGDWNVAMKDCSNTFMDRLNIDSGLTNGEDGLHWYGGSDHFISNSKIKSGDDSLSFENVGLGDSAGETLPLMNIHVVNCRLESLVANMIRIGRGSGKPAVGTVRISNVTGAVGNGTSTDPFGIYIVGASGSLIDDVVISKVEINGANGDNSPVYVKYASNVTLDKVRVLSAQDRPFYVDYVTGFTMEGCFSDAPAAGKQAVLIGENGACSQVKLKNNEFLNATHQGIVLGNASGGSVTDFEVSGNTVKGSTFSGLRLQNANNGTITGNRFIGNGAYGIQEISPSGANRIFANQVTGNTAGQIDLFAETTSLASNNVTA